MLTTGNIQSLFDVSAQTVRNWTKEFEDYLSMSATPKEKGSKRSYTPEDLTVFALVVEKTQSGATYEDIRLALKSGERAQAPEMVDEPDITDTLSSREIILISQITKERDIALGKLEQIEVDRAQDRDTIQKLNREIGRLEYELETLKDRLKGQDGTQ